MWDGNMREATKLGTCDTEWVQNSTSTQECCATDRSEKGCAWCLRNRFTNVTLPDSACSRWVESPCTRLVVATGRLKWTRSGCALVTSRAMPELVGSGHGAARFRVPDFHTFTSKMCTSLSLGHSAIMCKKRCPSSQLLYVNSQTIYDQSR